MTAAREFSHPEFSHIVRLDAIGRLDWPAHVEADETQRGALAARFGFASLDLLEADFSMDRNGATVMATGSIRARLAQPCIATGEPVAEDVREEFAIRFLPEESGGGAEADPHAEIELDADECDTLTYSGERIDMGEAIAETLALAVNPYPRSPDADRFLREAGVLSEDQAGPFAALAALKGKLGS